MFVIFRYCSIAPTVITFFAVPGELIESALPPLPSSLPSPLFPAANTKSTGCEPVTNGSASRTAAS